MGVLRDRGFRRLWLATVIGGFGAQFATFALSVTAVLVLGAGPIEVGVIAGASQAGWLLSLPIGVWVDRWRRRRILLTVSWIRCGALLSITAAYLLGVLTVAHLAAVGLALSICGVFFMNAHDAFVVALVGPGHVSEARARLEVGEQAVRVTGAGLAGQLLRVLAGPLLYLVAAALDAWSALLLWRVKNAESPPLKHERDSFGAAIRSGLHLVWRHPVLRIQMTRNAVINAGAGIFSAVVPVFILADLGLSPATYGLIGSAGAVGGVLAATVSLAVMRRWGDLRVMVLAPTLLPLAAATVPLAALVPPPAAAVVLGVGQFVFASVITIGSVAAGGVRAQVTPGDVMGRVGAASRFVTMGILPVGALVGGFLGHALGHVPALWICVAMMAVAAIIAVRSELLPHSVVPDQWKVAT